MAPEQFGWSMGEANGDVIVVLRGELDMATEPEATSAIAAAEGASVRRLVLDLSALSFMGSCGVRMPLATAERADGDGREMVIVPGRATERVLAATGVTDRFTYRRV